MKPREAAASQRAAGAVGRSVDRSVGWRRPEFLTMKPYFNTELPLTVLFEKWRVEKPGQLVGTCFAAFAMGFASVGLRALHHQICCRGLCGRRPEKTLSDNKYFRRTLSGLFAFLLRTIDYTAMLMAMYFNVFIFFSVIAGYSFAFLPFGHYFVVPVPVSASAVAVNDGCQHDEDRPNALPATDSDQKDPATTTGVQETKEAEQQGEPRGGGQVPLGQPSPPATLGGSTTKVVPSTSNNSETELPTHHCSQDNMIHDKLIPERNLFVQNYSALVDPPCCGL